MKLTPDLLHSTHDWNWLILIPLLPLFGVVLNTFIFRKAPEKFIGWFSSSTVLISFILSVLAFFQLKSLPIQNRSIDVTFLTWIQVGNLSIDWAVLLDPLSVVMMLIVTGVGGVIHIYSIGYMHGDPGFRKFFIFLNLFIFFMLWLVMGNSYPILFIGWEGVGLCSYLLIGFWYKDMAKASAGKKAFIVNRIGDWGFLLGMILLFVNFETLKFTELFSKVNTTYTPEITPTLTLITLLLFVGATGKSAQIPLYIWLPDAMAGPTPVSALIHAATMVTAGVYMVARSNLLFSLSPISMEVVATIGALTALFAATIGVRQWDIKKILAYSTVSQLGFMFLGVGVGAYETGIAHVMTHAFFKACLFLGSGAVIHSMEHAFHKAHVHYDPQDIRYMGGLRSKIPITYWTFLIATIAIAGIPGFSGFFSKDEILWKTFASGHIFLWVVATITAGITAFYMFRLVYLTFFGNFRGGVESEGHIQEVTPYMTFILILLAVLSVIGGYLAVPHALGGHFLIGEWLQPVLQDSRKLPSLAYYQEHHSLMLEFGLMGLSVIIAILGIYLASKYFNQKPQELTVLTQKPKGIMKILENKYWIDELYEFTIVQPIYKFSIFAWKVFDATGIDGFINSIGSLVVKIGEHLRKLQTGYLSNYALLMSIGILFTIAWLVFGK
ncbi:MAG: NADH-quinone oxidoreductase subunit L [bacterium]|nr:NADH-quinone oxidoreductase subunit L [bacterium]